VAKPKAMDKLSPESYFLRYAFPCTYVIKQRGDITQKTFDILEKAVMKSGKVDRALLESVYKKAFERLRNLAIEMKKDYWSIDVLKEYFRNKHNSLIMIGDGNYAHAPESLKEMCKVQKAVIVEKKEGFLVVKYNKDKTRVVGSIFLPNARIGDRVLIHHGFAVEMDE
jgi:hypothetical protein